MTFYFLKLKTIIVRLDSKILTLSFLRGKCDEKLYRLNLALILIGQFMWAGQIKSYNGKTIVNYAVCKQEQGKCEKEYNNL
jgi:hypothetical protein